MYNFLITTKDTVISSQNQLKTKLKVKQEIIPELSWSLHDNLQCLTVKLARKLWRTRTSSTENRDGNVYDLCSLKFCDEFSRSEKIFIRNYEGSWWRREQWLRPPWLWWWSGNVHMNELNIFGGKHIHV